MLLRRDGSVLITQPAHAWLAGRLARCWGGDGFAVPAPRDAVVLALSLHDIGWLDWERRPTLNATTGLPYLYDELAPALHTRLWAAGVEAVAAFGAYPALLVSRHGDAIYAKAAPVWSARPDTTATVHGFLEAQRRRQTALVRELRDIPGMGELLDEAHLALTRRFVAALDALSLHLCRGVDGTVADVPGAGATGVTLAHVGDGTVSVDPWPFRARRLDLHVEGRRFAGRCATQAALDEALAQAGFVAVPISLVPAA